MAQEAPLHFVVMVGSLRKGSFSVAIARSLPALAPEGVTIEPLPSVGEFPLYNHDMQDKGFPPIVTASAEAIRKADGVIIVTPEYNHSIPGVLKNAIDWISRLPNQPFAGKPIALESSSSVCMAGCGRNCICAMSSSISTGASSTNRRSSSPRSTRKSTPASGELTDPATRGFIADQLNAFAAFARG